MPISHEVDQTAGILRVRRWGTIETQDEVAACRARAEDPKVVPGIPVLVDCTGVEPADSAETVRYLADCVTRTAAELRCGPVAIVVATDVQYGMARMYMSLTELHHPRTLVFRFEPEALAWLDRRAASGQGGA